MQLVPSYLYHILTILGWRTFDPQGVVYCDGTPDDHWSSRSDDHGQASTSFCWRRSCWRIFESYTARGRPMITVAQEDCGRTSTSFCWRRRRRRRRRSCWRTFDLQGSYTGRGHPMTTGAQEMMTVDEL